MKIRIVYERAVNVLASSLAMVAQRLPFLKNVSPILGAGGGANFAAPLTVTFVGTHSLSGQSITILPLNGATDTATVTVGDQFVWSFKASRHRLAAASAEIDEVERLPDGLSFGGPQSGVMFIGGIPTDPGVYEITVKGYRLSNRLAGTTAPYLLTLTVNPGEESPHPFEDFIATFWSGEDLNDPLLVGATSDPDEDGIENVMEFLLDLDPTKPETLPGKIGIDPQDPQKIRYEFPLNAAATDVAVQLQQCSNLGDDWVDVPEAEYTREAELLVLVAPLAGNKFYRLAVELKED